ncbi:hypothetical protein CR513_12509, partial [Mucuna pruriens]
MYVLEFINLRRHVTPKTMFCLIFDWHKSIKYAYKQQGISMTNNFYCKYTLGYDLTHARFFITTTDYGRIVYWLQIGLMKLQEKNGLKHDIYNDLHLERKLSGACLDYEAPFCFLLAIKEHAFMKRSMTDPNISMKNLSPRSKVIVSYMRELGEKLEKVGRGLGLVQKDTQSVNAKVKALSKEKEERNKITSFHESERKKL